MKKSDMPLFKHQEQTAQFWPHVSPIVANFSDAGTGKTRGMLEGYVRRPKKDRGRCLVLGTLSILQPAWGNDIEDFFPELNYGIAYAKDRESPFLDSNNDIVIMNHDGVNWLIKNEHLLSDFDTIIIDESTAFKNRTAQRTKRLMKLMKHFKYRGLMTGTPDPNGLQDLWAQIYLLDSGVRLTPNFFHYRNSTSYAKQTGPDARHVQWIDKPGAEDAVTSAISDITLRFKLEECVDMPELVVSDRRVRLPSDIHKLYEQLYIESILQVGNNTISAVHAAALGTKLRQMASGAVYGDNGPVKIYKERHQLALDLALEVPQSLIAFNFRHERDSLIEEAEKRKVSYAVIDGDTPVKRREAIVADYQSGKIQVILCHPQSAGHGLTLTNGTRTIWCSPTYNAEHYEQLNRRQYRAGQKNRVEIIRIMAEDTIEETVYAKLDAKHRKMIDTLTLLKELSENR